MANLTPRLDLPYPQEREEPYYQTAKGNFVAVDAGVHANAENSQLQFMSTGILGWDAVGVDANTGLLFWVQDILVSAFSTTFKAKLAGPASIALQDNEVVFFVMPRVMTNTPTLQLYRSNRIFFEGTRLTDLRLFCARVGTTLYFYNGKSLKSGDTGLLFGGGLDNSSIFPAHNHLDPLVINPPAAGLFTLDAQITTPDLLRLYLFRNGELQVSPDDYTLVPGTGIITLVIPTATASERFVILREVQNTTVVFSTHTHLSALKIVPLPATTILDILVANPVLQGADLFRNGELQAQPDDYSLDTSTGFVTLVIPTVPGEVFQALRRINI